MQANLHEKLEEARAADNSHARAHGRTLAARRARTHTHTHTNTDTHRRAHTRTRAHTQLTHKHARTHTHERTPARAGGQSGGRRGHCEHSAHCWVRLQMCGSLQEAVDAKGLYLEHLARTVAASHAKLKQQARPGAPLDCPSSTP
jgi:hypothetical protein